MIYLGHPALFRAFMEALLGSFLCISFGSRMGRVYFSIINAVCIRGSLANTLTFTSTYTVMSWADVTGYTSFKLTRHLRRYRRPGELTLSHSWLSLLPSCFANALLHYIVRHTANHDSDGLLLCFQKRLGSWNIQIERTTALLIEQPFALVHFRRLSEPRVFLDFKASLSLHLPILHLQCSSMPRFYS